MSDKELIELIAQIWVSHGGDAIGFELCRNDIEKKIKELRGKEADDEETE
jgi:hypothetical protein